MKGQERDHRPVEILDVLSLGLVTAAGVWFLLLGEPFRESLHFEFGTNPFDGRRRCPNAP